MLTAELIAHGTVPSLHVEVVKASAVLWITVKIKIVVLVFNSAPQRQIASCVSTKKARWPEGDLQRRGDRRGFLGLYMRSMCSTHGSYRAHARQEGTAKNKSVSQGRGVLRPTVHYLSAGSGWIFWHQSTPFLKESLARLSSLAASPYSLGCSFTKKEW